jgi:uncharacterized membrane protein (Fun14 family)
MAASISAISIGGIFAILGFFLAFSLQRATNIILLGIFTYGSLLALDYMGESVAWPRFMEFVNLLSQLGKTILSLISGMLSSAKLPSITCFLLGGFLGILIKRR